MADQEIQGVQAPSAWRLVQFRFLDWVCEGGRSVPDVIQKTELREVACGGPASREEVRQGWAGLGAERLVL